MLSDVRKEDENLRLESEFFKKNCLAMNEKLLKFKTESLDFYSLKITDGTHYTPQYQETGIPFLSALNVKENYLNVNAGYKFISQKEHLELTKRCKPQPNDVLLRKVGVGARWACLVPENIFEFSIFVSVSLIKLNKKINPYYVTTFINSDLGQAQLLRFNKGISQPDLHLEEIKKLKIPFLSEDFQGEIESIIKISHLKTISYKKSYAQAETILLNTLCFESITSNTEKVNIKSFRNSFGATGRLDAEYYQKKYDYIESAFNKFDRIKLRELVNYPISSGITPKAGGDDYTDSQNGVPFIRAVDLQDGQVSPLDFNYVKQEIHNGTLKRTQLKKNDFLFSIAGTVGRCAIFKHSFRANINQAVAILRFNDKRIDEHYLLVLFNSDIGKEFVSKYARQGLQTNLNLAELGDLSIPILPAKTQSKIASLVQESFTLKAESERLLDVAKKAVEMAIEHNEETAIKFLTMETK